MSVRSGARESMPGMLDTVLNLGLNDTSVEGLARATDNERFAWDSYRRFVQMFGNVSRGVPGEKFENAIKEIKADRGVKEDTELDTEALQQLTRTFQELYDFPQDPQEQLRQAIRAVFDSWTGDRAVEYRRINRIPDEWGTAVNVQQMVFGNKGDTSGSGVAFSRDEVTGEAEPSGDFLPNAQGEDVVSGVRNPRDIGEMQEWLPEAHEQLLEILRTLEAPLQGHAGHRVHGRGGAAVHAPDPQRQAPGAGGGAVRVRRGGRGAAVQGGGDRHDRPLVARRAPAPDVRPRRPTSRSSPAASTRRRARPRARWCSRRRMRWRRGRRGAT